MIPLPRREHKLLLAIHGWTSIALGLLLFVIVATGTVAVLGAEIGAWSAGALVARSPLTGPVDADVKRLVVQAPATLKERLDLDATAANQLRVTLHGSPGPRERGLRVDLGPDGREVARYEGLTRDIATADDPGVLANFLIGVHVRLYLPAPWGLILTGVAGLAMMVAAISGLFIHRHLFSDAFTLRRGARPALAQRDRHGVAAAWTLPFVFLLGLTGSFLSFAGSVGLPALAWVSFGGDGQKLFATLLGAPSVSDATPAEGADLDGILADAATRLGTGPDRVSIAHPGRADATVTVVLKARADGFGPLQLLYDGVSGRFLREKPTIGRVSSAGSAAVDLMVPLHFGDFAGIASKLAWVALGFATCFITHTGMRLWLIRRDLARPCWMALDRATSVASFGLPFAMGTAAMAHFATMPSGASGGATPTGFVAGALLACAMAVAVPRPSLDLALRCCGGLSLLALPAMRLLGGGPSWSAALAAGRPVIVAGDVGVALVAAAFLAAPVGVWLRRRRHVAAVRPGLDVGGPRV